jgi:hypothetical protein
VGGRNVTYKMKLLNTTILVFMGVFFLQCKKENINSNFTPFFENSTFESENRTDFQAVRLFTRNREITDTQFIRNFIERYTTQAGFPNPFRFGISSEPTDTLASIKIRFHSNNLATIERYPFFLGGSLETHQADVSIINPSELLLTEKDSIYTLEPMGECADIGTSLLSYPPVGNCSPSGNPIPSFWLCHLRYRFPVLIQNEQITVPMIDRMTVRIYGQGFFCMNSRYLDVRNTFRSSVVGSLQTNDTVAIQIRTIRLKKV